ncbi:MAG: nuclear transport factor 2 family protein [Acidobacteriaceae bacterium]|nr:nuclear transport factor 2 family protein [Acidobacteriaceae bacterium]
MTTIYSAFNRRDIQGALAFMSERVSWPKASEGGRAVGKDEIRDYWRRQWQEFDPHVEPLEVIDRGADQTDVRVHMLVKNLNGEVLSDGEVWHCYTFADGLIERMDFENRAGSERGPAAAFSRQ